MNGTLLVVIVSGLLLLGLLMLAAVVVAAVGLLFLRRRSEEPAVRATGRPASRPPPRPEPARGGRASEPPPRPSKPAPPAETEWAASESPKASRPPSRPPASAPTPLVKLEEAVEPPQIGFFDDETSTGQASLRGQAQLQSLSNAFLSVPPTPAPRQLANDDDSEDEGEGATEIFSASAINAELAALLDEPDEAAPIGATPAQPKRR